MHTEKTRMYTLHWNTGIKSLHMKKYNTNNYWFQEKNQHRSEDETVMCSSISMLFFYRSKNAQIAKHYIWYMYYINKQILSTNKILFVHFQSTFK